MTTWQRSYDGTKLRLLPMPGVRPFHGVMMNVDPAIVANMQAVAQQPFTGLTTDGTPRRGLYAPAPSRTATEPVVKAAQSFLDQLDQLDFRLYAQQPFDSWHRFSWFNAAPLYLPAGVLLDDLRPEQREAAMAVVRQVLSPAGFELLRQSMRVNDAMGSLFNFYTDTLREWAVWFTIFGEPSAGQPWGFQLMGTHIDINCTVAGGAISLEPLFLGAELCDVVEGPYAGLSVYGPERDAGLALGRTLTGKQREQAVLYPSMASADLPPELGGPMDGRHIGGAGRDNDVIPYAGLRAADMSTEQQALLTGLIEVYLSRLPDGQREQRWAEIAAHLDETHVAWIGDPEQTPFYYRVHSPTLWVEFDHHPALMFDQPLEATPLHVHTIMRAPNGGDYGMARVASA